MEKNESFSFYFKPKLALPCLNKIIIELVENIYYCEADDNYSRLFLECGKHHFTSHSLKKLEETLVPYHFIRCHRSYLISTMYIKELDKKKNLVILSNGNEIPVSQTYRKKLMGVLLQNCIRIV